MEVLLQSLYGATADGHGGAAATRLRIGPTRGGTAEKF